MPKPVLSVVIATRDRHEEIARCLAAVRAAARAARGAAAEVIVVDDGSRDGTPARLRTLARTWGRRLPLRPVCLPSSRGPAGARNAGAAAARAPWIAFTDSDCLPARGWLAAYARAIARHPRADLLEGPVLPAGAGRADPYTHIVANRRGGQGLTSNLAVRAAVFRRLGGLDERFDRPCREDTDFYFTVLERGAPVPFVRDATVVHPAKPGRPGRFLRDARHAVHEPLLFCRHPLLYLTRLRWVDGWALTAWQAGLLVAAGWGAALAAGWLPGGRAAAAGAAALAAGSLAVAVWAGLRRRRATPRLAALFAAESLVVPFLCLGWIAVGAVRVAGIILAGRLEAAPAGFSAARGGAAGRTRGRRG